MRLELVPNAGNIWIDGAVKISSFIRARDRLNTNRSKLVKPAV
jgi:hypothetical protein